jgi:SagB-type dehydrogenase family enzyme
MLCSTGNGGGAGWKEMTLVVEVAMRRKGWFIMLPVLMMYLGILGGCGEGNSVSPTGDGAAITLPEPALDSGTSVEKALLERRSVRDYREAPLTLAQLGQLLWAAQGVTDRSGGRTAPSAGALYPLEVYAVIGDVDGLAAGVYRYRPDEHAVVKVLDGDRRKELARAALNQTWVSQGAIDIVITAIYERTTEKYGERGVRYVDMEAGHAAQSIYLQAVSLKLGTVTIGAFDDDDVKQVLGLPDNEAPLYIMPVGQTGDIGG